MYAVSDYDKIVYETAIEEGLTPLLASFMTSQARHESSVYASAVFKNCNNAFGYKYVGQSLAVACSGSPEGDKYAKYNSVQDSAREVARWIKRRSAQFENVKTVEEYAVVLEKNGYFGDNLSKYQAALARHLVSIKDLMGKAITKYPEATILTGVTFFSLVTYYIIKIAKRKK